ncbi:hypothetical protein ACIBI9_35305 [Nonomuraea sp. NPDC050451]|uniref:hypothetical protein n=1 Tax=Nonomuraea sp. NPDC050451 TaxID=3364364 RepID=UPI0037A68578
MRNLDPAAEHATPAIDRTDVLTGQLSHHRPERPSRLLKRGDDLRHLPSDRAVRGRREPRVARNIPRRRGY